MGPKWLTTYAGSRKNFLEPYELHGGHVVIDGDWLAIEIYIRSARYQNQNLTCNSAFGGDYNIYAYSVKHFFNRLTKCNVQPIILLGGGMEEKKMRTLFERRRNILLKAEAYTPAEQVKTQLYPINLMHVFRTCLLQEPVKVVRCIFENNPCVVGVAKALNCPILSSDSDFYIFDVEYIPLYTVEIRVAKNKHGKRYMPCKMFKAEKLFPDIERSALPLLAVLLGEDCISGGIFQNFFNALRLWNERYSDYWGGDVVRKPYEDKKLPLINAILMWLSERKLNEAVAGILSTLPAKFRRDILKVIEVVVNGYLVVPFDMLVPLGLSQKYLEDALASSRHKGFNFYGNVGTLDPSNYWTEDEINLSSKASYSDLELPFSLETELGDRRDAFADTLPSWFKYDYYNAEFPSDFIDMMFHRYYVAATQIEDRRKACAEAISVNIIRVIDGLLVAGREESNRDLTYIIREGRNLVAYTVTTVYRINSLDLPSLHELRDTPIGMRKQIFDETLEISEKDLVEGIPSEWRLYIAVIVYWINRSDESSRNTCHVYALLFAMLLGIVDEHISKYRRLNIFSLGCKLFDREFIISKSKQVPAASTSPGETIIDARQAVTQTDCLEAASFFISNYTQIKMLVCRPEEFDVTIVHAFSQFQSCLNNAVRLNALLGCPYETPAIEKLYNGTMLYNMYIQFEKHFNAESYIAEILGKAPSLLLLLDRLIAKVKMLVDTNVENGYRGDNEKKAIISLGKARKDKKQAKENKGLKEKEKNVEGKKGVKKKKLKEKEENVQGEKDVKKKKLKKKEKNAQGEKGAKKKKNVQGGKGGKEKENKEVEVKKKYVQRKEKVFDELSDCSKKKIKQVCTPKVWKLLDIDNLAIRLGRGVTKHKNKKKRNTVNI